MVALERELGVAGLGWKEVDAVDFRKVLEDSSLALPAIVRLDLGRVVSLDSLCFGLAVLGRDDDNFG